MQMNSYAVPGFSPWVVRYNPSVNGGTVEKTQDSGSTWNTLNNGSGILSAKLASDGFIYVSLGGGNYLKSIVDQGQWISVTASEYDSLSGAVNLSDVPTASTDPVSIFETNLSLTNHQIRELANGTAPKDAINLSQLTAAVSALTIAYQAGDTANADAIDALELAISNLPAGITMAQVQSAINASVAEAVLNEVIDDAQKQALVDALLAQLATVDTAVISRVTATEASIASLEPRVSAAEAKNAAQDTALAALASTDASQAAEIAALAAQNQQRIVTDAAHAQTLQQLQASDIAMTQAITPVKVMIVNGSVSEAIGVAVNAVTIDNSNTSHMQVSINLGTNNSGKDRDGNVYRLLANGVRAKIGVADSQLGETYTFAFLKESLGSTSTQIVLN